MQHAQIKPRLPGWQTVYLPRMILALGVAAIMVPTMYDVARLTWTTEQGGHAPIILATGLWLLWRESRGIEARPPRHWYGFALLIPALAAYAVGRITGILEIEAMVMYCCLVIAAYCMVGGKMIKALWFPIFFVVFLVPIPGSMLDAILFPLKTQVSFMVEFLLYNAGYPVARTGVVLTIGQYQLLIADACSGLNSMIALSGVGLLFVFLMQSRSVPYNLLMLVSILPIAFVANICRVLLLMLVTYYQGDRFGQEFHNYAGYLEILFAFGGFFAFDALLRLFVDKRVVAPLAPAV